VSARNEDLAGAWEEGYRAAMFATIGLQGLSRGGAQFPADWADHNPYRKRESE